MSDRLCVLAPVYWPAAGQCVAERPPVSESARRRLDGDLADIASLYARVCNPEPAETDTRRYAVRDWKTGRLTGDLRYADPLAPLGGVGPIRSRPDQPRVSGTPGRGVPVDLDVVDLTWEARSPNATDQGRAYPQDQVGFVSVATLLDQMVRDWRAVLCPDQHLPDATVHELVAWMRNRVDDACDWYPAIVDNARELMDLRSALRGVLGETEPKPEVLWGVPCPSCNRVSTLERQADGPYVVCRLCRMLMTMRDRQESARKLLAKAASGQ